MTETTSRYDEKIGMVQSMQELRSNNSGGRMNRK